MTVIARRVPAVPAQMPGAAWDEICALLSQPDSATFEELRSIKHVGSMLITEEYTRDAPIILSGTGPQVRVYTLHGDDSIDAEPPASIPFDPTDGDWRLSLPAAGDDVHLARSLLVGHSDQITIRDIADAGASEAGEAKSSSSPASCDLTIDLGKLES